MSRGIKILNCISQTKHNVSFSCKKYYYEELRLFRGFYIFSIRLNLYHIYNVFRKTNSFMCFLLLFLVFLFIICFVKLLNGWLYRYFIFVSPSNCFWNYLFVWFIHKEIAASEEYVFRHANIEFMKYSLIIKREVCLSLCVMGVLCCVLKKRCA